ncbi:MAG: spermidine synthase [Verrucomicrobiales bacterium]|jgi:spermidine synthase|nr:spermidine synthase [Verrucomicrobiales bacterium]
MHKPQFEELDFRETELGDLILRRRTLLSLGNEEIYEVLLGDGYLMSSLFTVVEKELSNLGLAAAQESTGSASLEVVVGGLGLGYTAVEALKHESVKSLIVVDFMQPVIEWHEKELVPLGASLNADPRCRFIHGDFFRLALPEEGEAGFDPDNPGRKFHAVLLDIDHSPEKLLHDRHGDFYSVDGLQKMAEQLHSGGVFALWSDDPPEETFMAALGDVFESCESHVVGFYNPLQDKQSESTVYVAQSHR